MSAGPRLSVRDIADFPCVETRDQWDLNSETWFWDLHKFLD
jgi:hypothetical protein